MRARGTWCWPAWTSRSSRLPWTTGRGNEIFTTFSSGMRNIWIVHRSGHGSAPDIAGQGIANPVGQIWCGSMMLDHLGHPEAAAHLLGAIEDVLAYGPGGAPLTPDLHGTGTTVELGHAIAERVRER
jgi:isocitrate/isopropylmalate dehydrogenase